MRFQRPTVTAAGAVALSILLTGCLPPQSGPIPEPVPTSTPVFASEDEALAAAEEAYREYLAVADSVAARESDPASLYVLVTDSFRPTEEASTAKLDVLGWTARGTTKLRNFEFQSLDELEPGFVEVRAYACLDLSAIDFFDASGSVMTTTRADLVAVEIAFVNSGIGEADLLLSEAEPWPNEAICD